MSLQKEERNMKEAKTFEEQLNILKGRGLLFKDEMKAIEFLRTVNYYRFSGYFRLFYSEDCETFKENTTFEDVYDLYCFDRKLRIILFDILQEIEVSIKTSIAYEIGHKYSPCAWKNIDLFVNPNEINERNKKIKVRNYNLLQERIQRKLERAEREPYIQHHKRYYNGEFPTWVIMEALDFGDISKFYKNLKTFDKKEIARKHYNRILYIYLEAWLEQFVILRNICAHHGRIVGRKTFQVKKSVEIKELEGEGLFSLLIAAKLLLCNMEKWDYMQANLILIFENVKIDLELLDFPRDWKEKLRN